MTRLQNELYRIVHLERESDKVRAELQLNATHFIYRAHFPDEPVTPGACIVQIARELLEIHLARELRITGVKNAKFLSVISPHETPRITYFFEKISVAEDEVRIQLCVGNGKRLCAKISMTCK